MVFAIHWHESAMDLCVINVFPWRRLLRVSWASGKSNQSILKGVSPEYSFKDWCWSWNANTLATWCKELTHWKRPCFWERLKAGGKGDDRGWDGLMASLTRWTWVWASSGSWWWTEKPVCCGSMGSQRVGHDWATELNWTEGATALSSLLPSRPSSIKAASIYNGLCELCLQ